MVEIKDISAPIGTDSLLSLIKNLNLRLEVVEKELAVLRGNTTEVGVAALMAVFAPMALPEHHAKLREVCDRLAFYLAPVQSDDMLLFDVDGNPSKYKRAQVASVLIQVMYLLEVTREYIYKWLSIHTNLGKNVNTVKTLITRAESSRTE